MRPSPRERAEGATPLLLTGSVGILIAAVHAKIIPRAEGDALLRDMRRHGYHFSLDTLDGLL